MQDRLCAAHNLVTGLLVLYSRKATMNFAQKVCILELQHLQQCHVLVNVQHLCQLQAAIQWTGSRLVLHT